MLLPSPSGICRPRPGDVHDSAIFENIARSSRPFGQLKRLLCSAPQGNQCRRLSGAFSSLALAQRFSPYSKRIGAFPEFSYNPQRSTIGR
jgi:hypothetical protein